MTNTYNQNQPCFVWLGVGEGLDTQVLDTFLDQYPDATVTLVDARASAASVLEQRYSGNENFSIICLALSIKIGTDIFYTLNIPELSAMRKPMGLAKLFPGVVVEKSEPMETLKIDDFVASLNLEKDQPNQLYVDIPAQAYEFVRELIDKKQHHLFSEVHISTSIDPLYDGADLETAQQQVILTEQGYELVYTDCHDPDMPVLSFKLNPLWSAYSITKQKLADLKIQFDSRDSQIKELETKLVEQETLVTELIQKNKNLTADLAKSGTLIGELINKRDTLTKALIEKDKLIVARENDLEVAKLDVVTLEKLQSIQNENTSDLKSQLGKALSDKNDCINRIQKMDNEYVKLDAQLTLIQDLLLRENT